MHSQDKARHGLPPSPGEWQQRGSCILPHALRGNRACRRLYLRLPELAESATGILSPPVGGCLLGQPQGTSTRAIVVYLVPLCCWNPSSWFPVTTALFLCKTRALQQTEQLSLWPRALVTFLVTPVFPLEVAPRPLPLSPKSCGKDGVLTVSHRECRCVAQGIQEHSARPGDPGIPPAEKSRGKTHAHSQPCPTPRIIYKLFNICNFNELIDCLLILKHLYLFFHVIMVTC